MKSDYAESARPAARPAQGRAVNRMTAPTKALAAFAATFDAATLPREVHQKLGWLLLDFLRVSSLGARLPWSDWARGYAGVVGKPGSSHVLFSRETLNPQHATFLNVTFGSSFDADDTHVGAMLHPGVAVWSAALATAEHVGATGRDVIAAVVAGYETIIRIGLAMQPGHFKRGFQSTGTCDVFGTAATAGRLLFGHDERKIQDAIGFAGSYPSGVAQFYYSGSSGKRIQAAHSAQSGVAAALLTQHGFSGPGDILEGAGGFARAYGDRIRSLLDRRRAWHALSPDERADEITRRCRARRSRHRRHAVVLSKRRTSPSTTSSACGSVFHVSSRAG